MRGELKLLKKNKFQFSKLIIIIETLLTMYVTYEVIELIKIVVVNGFDGNLPYLTTLITVVWGAYGVSVSYYYSKSKCENVEKIKSSRVTNKYEGSDL